MNKKIIKLDFSRLSKFELPNVANRVIEIVEKHNPETFKVKELFDELVEQKPQINKLKIRFGAHPLTKEMNDLRTRLRAFAIGITNQMKTIEIGKVESMQAALKVAQPVVNLYIDKIWNNNNVETEEKVSAFFDNIDANEELEVAFTTLNMSTYLDELRSVLSELVEHFNNRGVSYSSRVEIKTNLLAKPIIKAIRDLFLDIELAQVKNKDLDYTPLVYELNTLLTYFDRTINVRASHNKKKAEKETDINDNIIDDSSVEPIVSSATNMRSFLLNEDAEEMVDLKEADKKKTVALSTTTKQLPISSTEA